MVGELAAGQVPQVQLDARAGLAQRVRRVGHRIAAPGAVAQDEFHVLARMELQRLAGRQLQAHHHHVVRQPREALHAHRHLADRHGAGLGDLARLEHHVARGMGAAGEHEAGELLLGAQGLALVRAQGDLARELAALAGAAGAVFAAVGEADALADAGRQDGFVAVDHEVAPAGFDGDGKARLVRRGSGHRYSSGGKYLPACWQAREQLNSDRNQDFAFNQ
jgi:hypothetical protein